MPIAKETSAPRNPIPAGLHHAICYAVVDLGTQPPMPNSQYNRGPTRKVMLMFEFPEERAQYEYDGKQIDRPKAISKDYTMSLQEKAGLRQTLVSWRGRQFTAEELKGFDLKNVLGANCMINIVHKDNGYEEIKGVMPLARGMTKRGPENEVVLYDIGEPIPATLPEWVRKRIENSEELRNGGREQGGESDHESPPPPDDDDIPF